MNSHQVLEAYGMNKLEVVNLLVHILPELSLEELDYILMNVEQEFDYREQNGLIDDGE